MNDKNTYLGQHLSPSSYTKIQRLTQQRILVRTSHNLQLPARRAVPEPSPSRALDGSGSGVEFLLETVEPAKVLVDGLLERSVFEGAASCAGGCEVLPEEGVVYVACWERKRTCESGSEIENRTRDSTYHHR